MSIKKINMHSKLSNIENPDYLTREKKTPNLISINHLSIYRKHYHPRT